MENGGVLGQQVTDEYNNNRGAKGVSAEASGEDIKSKLARFKREREQLDAARKKYSEKEQSNDTYTITIEPVEKENIVQWINKVPANKAHSDMKL